MRFIRLFLVLFMVLPSVSLADESAQTQSDQERTVGLISGSSEGYTLFLPNDGRTVHLIDGEGRIVNQWVLEFIGRDVELTDRGTLVVNNERVDYGAIHSSFGPPYGWFGEYSWDGELLWSYEFNIGDAFQAHHGFELMPNGNLLFTAWEKKSVNEAIAMGRDPEDIGDSLWPDIVYEYDPVADELVWEWHAWDHLVQDFDPDLPNYGTISEHPHRININFYEPALAIEDWMHSNSVDYNAELDQILISVREFNELWIIDHGISAEEAAGPAGDLLYRWGNPRAYNRGTVEDRQLSFQHDAQWIPEGYEGAGNIIVYSNRHNLESDFPNKAEVGPPELGFSKVVEFTPPLQVDGTYLLEGERPYPPSDLTWSYGEDPSDRSFFSPIQSGVQRLSNGNTLITQSTDTVFLEVDSDGNLVWEYVPPFDGSEGNPAVFRARQYPADFAGFDGRDLTPGMLLVDQISTSAQP